MYDKNDLYYYFSKTPDITLNLFNPAELLTLNNYLDSFINTCWKGTGNNICLPEPLIIKNIIFRTYENKDSFLRSLLLIETNDNIHYCQSYGKLGYYIKNKNVFCTITNHCVKYVEVLTDQSFRAVSCIEDLFKNFTDKRSAYNFFNSRGYIKVTKHFDSEDDCYDTYYLLDGKFHGTFTHHYGDRIARVETFFKGKREGEHIEYHNKEPYHIKRISHWKNDTQHGERICYDKTGKMTSLSNYYASILHGKRIKNNKVSWYILGVECTEEEFNNYTLLTIE